ncbi:DUF4382 domain-containing protein [Peredibacter starrii]|uniref:DUF4382 domain-containing protein n=1 Tax=Peredibacter starrii TaxID=28202 RepID=A0AAX4HUJ0_9BACT|nr:DUF4382 domain-containing protein [Peredibacter starrii]WPU67063.1 DUF4382 domain-containing protein [Peredibacter starrii]
MKSIIQFTIALILLLGLISCNDKSVSSQSGTGSLRIVATDAPFDFDTVASAKLTIDSIKLRQASGNTITVMDEQVTLDLLQLRNGLVETLSEIEVPAGKYDEIMLIVSSATVDLKDERHFDLKVPSGAQSGLKVFVSPDLTVTTGLSHDVLLDFDLSRSFVVQGTSTDIKGFNFKPAIRAVNLTSAGSISGSVQGLNEVGLSGATVTVTKNDATVATAVTDEFGYFKVLGLTEGTYSVTAEKEGYSSLKNDSISVTAGNEVTTQFILTVNQ